MARTKGIPSHKKGKIFIPKIEYICINCKNIFLEYKSSNRKFCSHKCSTDYRKGLKRPEHSKCMVEKHKMKKFGYKLGENKGNKNPAKRSEVRKKISKNAKLRDQNEEKNPNWKGNNCSYFTLHEWVKKHLGKAKKCEFCGITNTIIHWANKSREYKRNLNDWLQLCPKCHGKYDKKNRGAMKRKWRN